LHIAIVSGLRGVPSSRSAYRRDRCHGSPSYREAVLLSPCNNTTSLLNIALDNIISHRRCCGNCEFERLEESLGAKFATSNTAINNLGVNILNALGIGATTA
jgi:hypothetical protein